MSLPAGMRSKTRRKGEQQPGGWVRGSVESCKTYSSLAVGSPRRKRGQWPDRLQAETQPVIARVTFPTIAVHPDSSNLQEHLLAGNRGGTTRKGRLRKPEQTKQ